MPQSPLLCVCTCVSVCMCVCAFATSVQYNVCLSLQSISGYQATGSGCTSGSSQVGRPNQDIQVYAHTYKQTYTDTLIFLYRLDRYTITFRPTEWRVILLVLLQRYSTLLTGNWAFLLHTTFHLLTVDCYETGQNDTQNESCVQNKSISCHTELFARLTLPPSTRSTHPELGFISSHKTQVDTWLADITCSHEELELMMQIFNPPEEQRTNS